MRQATWALVLACLFAEALAKCTPLRARSLAAAAGLRGGVEPEPVVNSTTPKKKKKSKKKKSKSKASAASAPAASAPAAPKKPAGRKLGAPPAPPTTGRAAAPGAPAAPAAAPPAAAPPTTPAPAAPPAGTSGRRTTTGRRGTAHASGAADDRRRRGRRGGGAAAAAAGPPARTPGSLARRAAGKTFKGSLMTAAAFAGAAATTAMPVPNTICIGATLGCALRTFVAFYSTIAFMVVGRGKRRAAAAASKNAQLAAQAAQAAR